MPLDRLIRRHYAAATLLALAAMPAMILAAVADSFPLAWTGLGLLAAGAGAVAADRADGAGGARVARGATAMKGRNSGQRKRLAAVVRERYVSQARGLPFVFRIGGECGQQKARDFDADDRRCLLAAAGRRSLRGQPIRCPSREAMLAELRSIGTI